MLAGGKILFEMHLKQSRFTYSACGPFTENKVKIQEFKCDGYHWRLASMVYKFLDKKSASASTHTRTGLHFENQQLAFRKFK